MRKVILRMNEDNKYQVIKKLVETNGNKQRAAISLGLSIRQINRLIAGYKSCGKEFFVHGNRGRKPHHALSNEFKDEIEALYINKYFDCTYTAFKEFLSLNEGINLSIDEVRVILKERYIFSPRTHKVTKKNYKKYLSQQLEQSKSKNDQIKIQNQFVQLEDAHPRQPRCINFGEEIQMDACLHHWFGKNKSTLHAAIDDATGQIVGAYFDVQETLNGYYNITHQILTQYGIPYKIKTDKRTVFEYKKKASSLVEEDTFTQYAYACKQLGIHIETSSIPEFKPRIERLFETLQQRIPQELRLAGITTMDEANVFLKEFVKRYNQKFALQINNNKSAFINQLDEDKINLILAVLAPRVIDKGHSIRYKNKYYRLVNSKGYPIFFCKGTKCMVIKSYDDKLYATIDENIFSLEEIPEVQALSENFDIIEEPKERKIYIPPMNHPWKRKSFEEFVSKQEHRLPLEPVS